MTNTIAIYELYHNLADEIVCPDRIANKRKGIKDLHLQKDFDKLKKAQRDLHLEIMEYYGFDKKIEKMTQDML